MGPCYCLSTKIKFLCNVLLTLSSFSSLLVRQKQIWKWNLWNPLSEVNRKTCNNQSIVLVGEGPRLLALSSSSNTFSVCPFVSIFWSAWNYCSQQADNGPWMKCINIVKIWERDSPSFYSFVSPAALHVAECAKAQSGGLAVRGSVPNDWRASVNKETTSSSRTVGRSIHWQNVKPFAKIGGWFESFRVWGFKKNERAREK